jgi:hypothetical protein
VQHAQQPPETGVASGMNANIRTIGGALGASAMVSIVTAGAAPGPTAQGVRYLNGFLMLSGVLVAQRAGRIVHPGKAARSAHPRRDRGRAAERRGRPGSRRHAGGRRVRVSVARSAGPPWSGSAGRAYRCRRQPRGQCPRRRRPRPSQRRPRRPRPGHADGSAPRRGLVCEQGLEWHRRHRRSAGFRSTRRTCRRGTVPRLARWRLAAFFVTPATLLRWYCQLMARRWPNRRRPERPPVAAKIQTLVLRLGVENRAVAVGGYTVSWSDPGRRSAPCG